MAKSGAIVEPREGDLVLITTKSSSEEGVLMPSPDKNIILIKLKTGYNVGFESKQVTKIKVLEKAVESVSVAAKITSKNSKLPTIAILHTGGTIASKVDYRTGGVVASFEPAELVALFPELAGMVQIESELIAKMWSDDLRFEHFGLIAKAIEKQVKKGVRGIIIGIGTDNLAVAAAALSFIVENPPVPIILVGSQRSSDRGSSDAAVNIICAARFMVSSDYAGVAICMHESEEDTSCVILPAGKTYKLHSSRRDAFKAINTSAIARVNFASGAITMLSTHYPKRGSSLMIIRPKMEEKVGLLKIHVNMFPEQFKVFEGYKGLIIEGTGLGHTPGQVPNEICAVHKKFYPIISKLIKSGCVVVMTTQCIFGGVNMNVYDKGRDLLELGVVPGEDMLANTALVKLSWLLANYDKKDAIKMIRENLHGEISEKIPYDAKYVSF